MPEQPAERPEETTAAAPRRARRRSAADKVRAAQFPVAMRGYDRATVDSWRQEIAELIERLEEQQPREAAVKRALDEVGHETSSILQRAHEAAEEITARSRSQAEGRLQRAEREADATLRDAEDRLQTLEDDIGTMWEQRARLIDDMRQLADEVLGVADDALDRMPLPQATDGEGPGGSDTDDTTAEVAAVDGDADRPAGPQPPA